MYDLPTFQRPLPEAMAQNRRTWTAPCVISGCQRTVEAVCDRSTEAAGSSYVYANRQMKAITESLRKVAAWDVPVVLRGESGAGKEVLARKLHRFSPRSAKAFVKINCVALPSELLESELFDLGVTVVPVKSQTGPINSTMGKLLWAMQAWFAEMENEERSETIKAGQARARAAGKPVGRPRVIFDRDQVVELRKKGLSWSKIARTLGVSERTLRRAYRSRSGVSGDRQKHAGGSA